MRLSLRLVVKRTHRFSLLSISPRFVSGFAWRSTCRLAIRIGPSLFIIGATWPLCHVLIADSLYVTWRQWLLTTRIIHFILTFYDNGIYVRRSATTWLRFLLFSISFSDRFVFIFCDVFNARSFKIEIWVSFRRCAYWPTYWCVCDIPEHNTWKINIFSFIIFYR